MDTEQVFFEAVAILERWAPRLGIAERVSVEVFPAGDAEARCAMRPARAVPEAMGLHDFVLELSAEVHADDLERTVLHELVHLLVEPLRAPYFGGGSASTGNGSREQDVERWETVIERVAHAFERAYDGPRWDEDTLRVERVGGREFREPA